MAAPSHVTIRATPDWHRRAKALALARGVSVSQMLRDVVDNPTLALEPTEPVLPLEPVIPVRLEGVPISALPPAGGMGGYPPPPVVYDEVAAEVVADAPRHYHRRTPVETRWEGGQKVTTYRCKDCGVPLT